MTRSVLLDTDVFSFFHKGDSRADAYAAPCAGKVRCLSFMTAAELERWAMLRRWGDRSLGRLREAMDACVLLVPDRAMVTTWAEVWSQRHRVGRPIQVGDCWIAATALRHGIPLVTHNARDYAEIPGLSVVSHGS